jgi:hypothetical protein
LKHIRKSEHEEAWQCLKAEFYCPEFNRDEMQNKRTFEQMMDELTEDEITVKSASEFERYKAMPPVGRSTDPLVWWRDNATIYPILSKIAKIYLSIPASQATCERSFSTAKRICSPNRTLLTPKHIAQLVFSRQNANELYEI